MSRKRTKISPSLFDLVARQARRIAREGLDPEEVIDESTPLIVFCLNFYRQYLKTFGINVTEPSDRAARDAARLRARLEKDGESKADVLLIGWFEEFCERYPDLTELVSPDEVDEEESTAVRDFYEDYMPTFLDRILAWAKDEKDDALIAKVSEVRDQYMAALESQ